MLGESQFQILLESLPNALVMVDPEGKIRLLNRRAEELFGYGRRELLGQPVELLLPERLEKKHALLRRDYTAHPEPRPMGSGRDLLAVRKDGFEVPVEIGLTPIETPGGMFVLASITDITRRKKEEEKLRQSEQHFRTLAEALPEIVWTANPEGTIDYANRRWYEFTGLSTDDPARRNWRLVIHPEDLPEAEGIWNRIFSEGRPAQTEQRLRRSDGSYRWHLMRTWPLHDSAGIVVKWFGTATDVDDLKRSEERLARLAGKLRRSNQELEQFAALVSHDLQQPLVVTSSYLQLLKRKLGLRLDPESLEQLEIAYESTHRMQEMIQGILDYSRVTQNESPHEPANLEHVLRQALRTLRPELEGDEVEITHDPLPMVPGDRTQLERVFQNLLNNAIKFRSPNRPLEVHVGAGRVPEGWLIWVQDNGIGMSQEDSEQIFQIFHRLHDEGEYPGTGLGLAICKKIVERHGGRIWVETRKEEGSRFCFTLPGLPDPSDSSEVGGKGSGSRWG